MSVRTYQKVHTWGRSSPSPMEKAIEYCLRRDGSIMLFILDVFVDRATDSISRRHFDKYPNAYHDATMITGSANEDVVDMCVARGEPSSEKPVRPYALQLAVRSIVSKYLKFAKMLLSNPDFAETIGRI